MSQDLLLCLGKTPPHIHWTRGDLTRLLMLSGEDPELMSRGSILS